MGETYKTSLKVHLSISHEQQIDVDFE
jgi:hypothetical protein